MVKICRAGLLKLNFEIVPKKRIFRFLPKISAGHGWSWKFFFANFQTFGPLGCQGWVVIPQNVKKSQNHCTLLTKPSQTGKNLIIPGQVTFGQWHPAWGRENRKSIIFFHSAGIGTRGNCTAKKKVSDFPVPSRDVTNQAIPGQEKFNYSRPGRVWLATSRLLTGTSLNLFYSVGPGLSRVEVKFGCSLFCRKNFTASKR